MIVILFYHAVKHPWIGEDKGVRSLGLRRYQDRIQERSVGPYEYVSSYSPPTLTFTTLIPVAGDCSD